MELEELRRGIDQTDCKIIGLYDERMGLSGEVARVKIKNRENVFNAAREKIVIERALDISGENSDPVRLSAFYRALMRQSRELQYEVISAGQGTGFLCDKPIRKPITPTKAACAGLPGSYTHIAAEHLYPKAEKLYMHTFKDVFKAVEDGACSCGVLPMDNTTEGSVTDVQQGVMQHQMYLTAAVAMPIRHCLAAPPGASVESIKEVYSHPQALGQCAMYLRKLGVSLFPDVNTSIAAEKVSRWGDISKGAVASPLAARLYGLSVIAADINDAAENMTRFVSISPTPLVGGGANRISLSFTLPHETGSLAGILSTAAEFGLNLVKVQSVPIPQRQWEYRFYVDILGNIRSRKVLAFLYMLFSEIDDISFLGNYREETVSEG